MDIIDYYEDKKLAKTIKEFPDKVKKLKEEVRILEIDNWENCKLLDNAKLDKTIFNKLLVYSFSTNHSYTYKYISIQGVHDNYIKCFYYTYNFKKELERNNDYVLISLYDILIKYKICTDKDILNSVKDSEKEATYSFSEVLNSIQHEPNEVFYRESKTRGIIDTTDLSLITYTDFKAKDWKLKKRK